LNSEEQRKQSVEEKFLKALESKRAGRNPSGAERQQNCNMRVDQIGKTKRNFFRRKAGSS
jgi:hypothetical protein